VRVLGLLLIAGCASLPRGDTAFLEELAFPTAQEHLLILGPDGLSSLRLSGREKRPLIDARDCAVAGVAGQRTFLRCGGAVYLVAGGRISEYRDPLPQLTQDDARVTGCTSGAPACVCGHGWSPRLDGDRLLWAHVNGDSEVVGFHAAGAVYLVHLRTGRAGRLGRGRTLRWPER
jgi:hypothetical protein